MRYRKLTIDGIWRILWGSADRVQWAEMRRVKLRRVMH